MNMNRYNVGGIEINKKLRADTTTVALMKRNHNWKNEVHRIAVNTMRLGYGDRFIPCRHLLAENQRNRKLLKNGGEPLIQALDWNLPKNYWLRYCVAAALSECFKLSERRILNFGDISDMVISRRTNGKDWACRPRNKPFVFVDARHDSNDFASCFETNLMDWSINGHIVVGADDNVSISKNGKSMSFEVASPTALAFCPKGKYLAVASQKALFPFLELWDINTSKKSILVVENRLLKTPNTYVECIEWSKCGSYFVCGVETNKLYVVSAPNLIVQRKIIVPLQTVYIMRFSCNMRHLAIGDLNGNIVVYAWRTFSVYLAVRLNNNSLPLFDWHPWNGNELAIAERKTSSIMLLHVPSKQFTAYNFRKQRNMIIHAITFNKITAELLVNISHNKCCTIKDMKILVLASLTRVVDQFSIACGAHFLMWHPNGTQAITEGVDESLTIWRFLPENEDQKKNVTSSRPKFHGLLYGFEPGSQFKRCLTIR